MRRFIPTALIAVTVAILAAAGTVAAQSAQRFDDVPTDHYAYDAINWMVANGITTGCGDGTNFCPSKPLTRAHVAAFLYRANSSTFSGAGDAVTDDLILEPGYYNIWIAFRVKPGYDWDDRESYDLYTRFKSKTDGWTLVNGEWDGRSPGEGWNKHSETFHRASFRVDEPGAHWFDIEADDRFVWWAEIHRQSTPTGAEFN